MREGDKLTRPDRRPRQRRARRAAEALLPAEEWELRATEAQQTAAERAFRVAETRAYRAAEKEAARIVVPTYDAKAPGLFQEEE